MNFLYQICIYPLVILIEVIYRALDAFFRNTGLSIIGVSLMVNIICLPVYAVAEKWQQTERDIQKKLKLGIDNIKAVFKGDEQYMILSTFYRQNHYHPSYALRSTFGLLIQIPFFIAAYTVLNGIPDFLGDKFLFINDLGSPDALLHIGALTVNLLPLVMTAVNVASSAVYTKGFSLREKMQLYAVAAVFCILLYNSSAALVFYWTLNNVFSLVKNILYKSKNPKRIAYILITSIVALGAAAVFLNSGSSRLKMFIGAILFLVAVSPLLAKGLTYLLTNTGKSLVSDYRACDRIFWFSVAGLAMLAGLVIPGSLIASSPAEFSFTSHYDNPLSLLMTVSSGAAGLFVFWPGCLYLLFSRKVRSGFALTAFFLLVLALCNAFLFQGNYGTLSPTLKFDDPNVLKLPVLKYHLDILFSFLICAAAYYLFYRKGTTVLLSLCAVALVSFFCLSGIQIAGIGGAFTDIREAHEAQKLKNGNLSNVYHFSKTKKNVLIIMLDRGIGSYIQDIFNETPGLDTTFSGFTWYPNTYSYGGHTVMAEPALFGGYEYTPEKINARKDETLVKKLAEASTVLPRLFSENGWKTTVTDMPYDEFASYPDIESFKLKGVFQNQWLEDHGMTEYLKGNAGNLSLERKLLFFSFFKIAPPALRWTIYDMGGYWQLATDFQARSEYLADFASLEYLGKLSEFGSEKNTFNIAVNDTTHDLTFLQYPGYTFENSITNIGTNRFSSATAWQLYHVNIAAIRSVGAFMEVLKKNDVYDNTRIVIASDHGFKSVGFKDKTRFPGNFRDVSLYPAYFNPILLVKDFGAKDPMKTDMVLMSNADVASIVTSGGIIAQAVNPYSLRTFEETADKKNIRLSGNSAGRLVDHDKNTFRIADDEWIDLSDSIFDEANWKWEK